jgi:hypothetical protein
MIGVGCVTGMRKVGSFGASLVQKAHPLGILSIVFSQHLCQSFPPCILQLHR